MSLCRIVTLPGFPTYEISECGGIRHKNPLWGYRWRKPQVRKTGGYLSMIFLRNGKPVNIVIHRLVALAFLGSPPLGRSEIAHIDGNRRNNHVSNLRWSNRAENMADARRHGTMMIGVTHANAKLTDELVREIRRLAHSGYGATAISRLVGTTPGNVRHVCNGRTWRHVR